MKLKLKKEYGLWRSSVHSRRGDVITDRLGGLWFCLGAFKPSNIIKAIKKDEGYHFIKINSDDGRDYAITFYPSFGLFRLTWGPQSYFSSMACINCYLSQVVAVIGLIITLAMGGGATSLFWFIPFFITWGKLYINLPFLPSKTRADAEYIDYGVYLYGEGYKYWFDDLVICRGNTSNKYIPMPWKLDWVRTSYLLKTGMWFHIISNKDRMDVHSSEFRSLLEMIYYPYTYNLKSGETQIVHTEVTISEREWRPIWFKWTGLFKYTRRVIDVEFSSEVGERTGTWKGGVTGCSYELKPNETPIQCIMRMEQNRKF